MMAGFDELQSVFYNYEVGYLEGLRSGLLRYRNSSLDELLEEIAKQEKKVEEEKEEEE